jgi:alpha-mannosidase
MPRVVLSRADAFCERLHERRGSLESGGGRLPVWDGELYLERHRGTYTTQAWIKRANRLAEEHLRVAEWLAVAGPRRHEGACSGVAAALDRAWKLTLLNQFHDILPGSSIGEVYRESRDQYGEVESACEAATRGAIGAWTGDDGVDAVVLNPCSTARSGVVEHGGRLRWAGAVPGLGMAPLDGQVPAGGVRIEGGRLSNGVIVAEIDSSGRVRALECAGGARLIPPGEFLNQLVVYDDSPKYWEAWDIDADYLRHAMPIVGGAETWRIVESGPLRGAIEVERSLGRASRINQRFVLDAGSSRLDVQTRIAWREHRQFLRVLFPSDIRSRDATCGIQFGHIRRPTHAEDPWSAAKFEVCAHRWVDLSEPGRGLAILSESKYGHSFRGGTIGLSLLRSTKFPDPDADMGEHSFAYSLMPHGGDWQAAGVDAEAEALNRPLLVVAGAPGQRAWAPFRITDGSGRPLRLEVAAVKPAEDGRRLIIRLVETRGVGHAGAVIGWGFPVRSVESVDVVERPRPLVMLDHDARAGVSRFSIRPFEIVTLAVERS